MSPQLENGYTKIADSILEKVASTKLNGTQMRILLIVWRSTYGWHKKEYDLSLSYLSKATGIHKQQIKKELDKMIQMGIITVVRKHTDTQPRVLGFNKNYVNGLQSTKTTTVSEKAYPTVSELTYPTVSEKAYQKKDFNKQYNKEYDSAVKIDNEFDYNRIRKLYPGTKTVSTAKKKLPKLIKDNTGNQMYRTVERYIKDVAKKRIVQPNLSYLNESTFWNGRYEDYLDNNYTDKEINTKRVKPKKGKQIML